MRYLPVFLAFCGLALAGCASRPDRTEIFVQTTPPGAGCTLLRDGQPIATVAPTPGIAWVPPSPSDIAIECRRSGFRDAAAIAHARPGQSGFFEASHGGYDSPVELTLAPR